MRKSYIVYFILLSILFLLIVAMKISSVIHQPIALTESANVELKRGSTIRTLSTQLHELGVLENPEYLEIWARLNDKAHRLQAGEYQLLPESTLAEFIDIIVSGKVKQYSLTLLEGWNIKQLIQAIHQHDAIKQTIHDVKPESLMQVLGLPDGHPEGQFFPDTYFIPKNITDVEVLRRAYADMSETLEQAWKNRDEGLPYKTAYEALTMASIIEKESAVADERTIIAGVFINRLRINMRLQTDPTVIYGIGEAYDGNIRRRDLRTDTPYNTYTRKGLPPTPIAMPGRGAIEAALHPAETKYLYFVAMKDNSGRHVFSSTLAEHEKAVDIHQRNR